MNYLLGLIGHPVSHSCSPALHKAALRHFGLTGDYQLFDTETSRLQERLTQLRTEGLIGVNITIPHKQEIYPLCQVLSPEAASTKAVNTITFIEEGSIHGHNTDVVGLAETLQSVYKERPRTTACILGAGGAAKAALYVLQQTGFGRIYVVARNLEKARELVNSLENSNNTAAEIRIVDPVDYAIISGAQLIVNTLPLGQTIPRVPDWLCKLLEKSSKTKPFVFDLVYPANSGQETLLVTKARAHALAACDGSEMLIRQAAHSFAFWTGKKPPYELLREAFIGGWS